MKFFKIIGIFSMLIFSFYLTDYVTNIAMNNNPIMKTIKEKSNELYVSSVNAIIEKNTIIPGIRGKKVNEIESFIKMKDFKAFNTNYIIYDEVKPKVSIEDNYNKIIISGNKNKRNISLLIINNKYNFNNIKYTKLIKFNNKLSNIENINIENKKDQFNDVDTILNKKELNKKICILNYSNIEMCKQKKYYIINPTLSITNINILKNINKINNGSIIILDDNLNKTNIDILLKRIKSMDLKIVTLSELIKE